MKTLLYLVLVLAATELSAPTSTQHTEQVSPPVNIAGSF